jgi:hypothetical protein
MFRILTEVALRHRTRVLALITTNVERSPLAINVRMVGKLYMAQLALAMRPTFC